MLLPWCEPDCFEKRGQDSASWRARALRTNSEGVDRGRGWRSERDSQALVAEVGVDRRAVAFMGYWRVEKAKGQHGNLIILSSVQ